MSEPGKAVFLSYASQDAEAAHRLCDALRAAGIEVWFDQSELRGGDAWDASIRRQIKNCALFIPVISRNTHARDEGYFRLEWKLAVDRSHLIAADRAFLLPVVVDDTSDQEERVPDRFREVQWTRAPAGDPPADFVQRVARLTRLDDALAGEPSPTLPAKAPKIDVTPASGRSPNASPPSRSRTYALVVTVVMVLIGAAVFIGHEIASRAKVIPYSAEDRRMTFAMLPLQGAADDLTAQQVAKATGEVVFKSLDENHEWLQLARRESVEQALRQFSAPRDLARTLNVHFLMRGSVAHSPSGYDTTLFVVDGETERVLGSRTVPIPVNATQTGTRARAGRSACARADCQNKSLRMHRCMVHQRR